MMEYESYEVDESLNYARNGGEVLISSTSMRTQFNEDIKYDDKDKFSGVTESKVLSFEDMHNSPDERAGSSEERFRMGEKVEALHKSNEYRAGLIVAVNRDANLYDVSFDDGTELMDLAPHLIRKLAAAPAINSHHQHHHRSHHHHHHKKNDKNTSEPSSTSRPHYKPGDQVEAMREGNKLWRFAVIAKTHHDHTYDVIYSDRVRENRLTYDLIRPLFEKTVKNDEPAEKEVTNKKIDFSDFEKHEVSSNNKLQTQGQPSNHNANNISSQIGQYRLGMEVEARYHGGQLYYPGTITKVSSRHQTCDIRYEDGDQETFVPMDYIRPRSDDHSRGKSRAAAAAKKNDDDNKNQLGASQQQSNGPAFAKDMEIEGNFQGKNLWYPGKITAIRVIQPDDDDDNDGLEEYRYAVHYRDGDDEENVPEFMLRMPKLKKLIGHATYDTDEPVARSVQMTKTPNNTPAHYTATAASSEGKESKINKNNRPQAAANVISTAAGDVMVASRPPNSNQRPATSGNNNNSHNSHRVTRPAPMKRAQSSVIMTLHGNDDDYDEGPISSEQQPRMVIPRQPLTPAPSNFSNSFRTSNNSSNASSSKSNRTTPQQSQKQQQLQQQQQYVESTPSTTNNAAAMRTADAMQAVRIEVNYHGQGVWYPGHLVKERKDGTVDVAYDDGDKESAVTLDRIRPLQAQKQKQELQQVKQIAMKIGDRVAANYQGQGRYYPGVVKKVWRDNRFFDVLYDDGDEERKIPCEHVHRLEVNVKSNAPRVNANNSRPGTANSTTNGNNKTNSIQPLALSPRGRWAEGSLVEMKATKDGDKEKWLVGHINRLLTTAGGVVAAVDIKLLNGEIIQEVPVEFLRIPLKKSANVIPAMSLDMSAGGSSKQKGNNGNDAVILNEKDISALRLLLQQKDNEIERLKSGTETTTSAIKQQRTSNDSVMLNEKDISALRLLLQQKDSEIERLKSGAEMTSSATKQQQQQQQRGRPQLNSQRSRDTNALDITTPPLYQPPVIADSKGVHSSELAALTKANDDLKRSVAFLGQKFTLVVEELVHVKQREEQLQRQLQKQADMIRQVVDGQKKMVSMLNNSYRD